MKITIKKWILFLIAIVVLGGIYFAGYNHARQERNNLLNQLKSSQDSIKTYSVKIDGLIKTSYEISQDVITEREAKEAAIIERDKYKQLSMSKITEVTKLKGTIDMLLDSIHNNATIVHGRDSMVGDSSYIKLPFKFEKKNKFVDLSGSFDLNGNMSTRLIVPVDLDITVGLSKSSEPKISVLTDNPYLIINSIKSNKIIEDKHWYDSKWIYIGIGFAGASVLYMISK